MEIGVSFCAFSLPRGEGQAVSGAGRQSSQAEDAWIYEKGGADKMRVKITLRCNECKQRNYNTVKNKKNDPDRLEMNKYCPFCRKHTVHSETK